MPDNSPPVFRFAPSPNGALHLGHAYSALLNQKLARDAGGKLLIRIEDIDQTRCTRELETAMLEDLNWIGIEWAEPPYRQSDVFARYQDAIDNLIDLGLIYPAFMSRGDIRRYVETASKTGSVWPSDPDGSPIYPGTERNWSSDQVASATRNQPLFTKRLNMQQAMKHLVEPVSWSETGFGPDRQSGKISADPLAWGDVVLARSDTPTSYHLSVVVDDALQGVSHVVRGHDLFYATSVHRLLQNILGLPVPTYHHHKLILDESGQKLSKSLGSKSIRSMRQCGMSPDEVRQLVGF